MQYLNNDMEELFRKAADDYPLNTGTPDWNKVAVGLKVEASAKGVQPKRYRRYTWLLLLLPIGFIAKEIFDPFFFEPGPLQSAVASGTGSTNDNQPDSGAGDTRQEKTDPALKAEVAGPQKTFTNSDQQTGSKSVEINPDKQTSGTGDDKYLSLNMKSTSTNATNKTRNGLQGNGSDISKGSTGNPDIRNVSLPGDGGVQDKGLVPLTSSVGRPGKNIAILEPGTSVDIAGDVQGSVEVLFEPYTRTRLEAVTAAPDISLVSIPGGTIISPGPITKQKIKTNNFYLGVIGGLDVTTVKLQETSKTGSHYGAIAGYSFARKWSVEVGFIVEKKYYYTDGKYFDRSKLNLNPNTTVISVDGECKMFELPVSVKYDITNTYRSNFFVTGGLSSYIMKQENYTMVWGYASGSRGTHYYPYKNSSKNFFAEIRLTGGYAMKLPKQFSVRIEPYLNIPVTGVGSGKLDLMSAGLNAGIFRRIF